MLIMATSCVGFAQGVVAQANAGAMANDSDLQSRLTGRGAFVFDPEQGTPELPPDLRMDPVRYPDYDFYIVQFVGPVLTSWIDDVRSLGIAMFDYLPSYSFIIEATPDALKLLGGFTFVRWAGLYEPAYKLDPALLYLNDTATVTISVFPSRQIDRLLDLIISSNSEVQEVRQIDGVASLVARVSAGLPVQIAQLPEASWIEPSMTGASFLNERATWVLQTNVSTPIPNRRIFDHNITGTGQVVTLVDTGVFVCHEMFRQNLDPNGACAGANESSPLHRKVVAYQLVGDCSDRVDGSGHGTHVAGTIAGDAPTRNSYTDQTHDGHAFNARIIVQDAEGPDPNGGQFLISCIPTNIYEGLFNLSRNAGSKIHSDSWEPIPAPPLGSYCSLASSADRFMWNFREFLIVFAAGNRGPANGTISCTGSAKNIVTVGATENGGDSWQMMGFSSRGPAVDNRTKPTVVAPGSNVSSAGVAGVSSYTVGAGTSVAAPAIAGSAALVRQYFVGGSYPGGSIAYPSAALVKAVLINGAVEIGGRGTYANGASTYPNNNEGWGRVLLDGVLKFTGDARQLKVLSNGNGTSLATGQWVQYFVNVASGSEPFEATLVWTDYPGTVGAAKALVNDLDVIVVDPNGVLYKGNVFSGRPGQSLSGGAFDRVNVEEGVLRLQPVPGIWTIKVVGRNIPHGPQPFALVVTGAFGSDPGALSSTSISPSSQTVYYNPVCNPFPTASFTGSATGGSGTYRFIWDFGDSATDVSNPISHRYTNFGTGTVTVAAVDSPSNKVRTATASVYFEEFDFC